MGGPLLCFLSEDKQLLSSPSLVPSLLLTPSFYNSKDSVHFEQIDRFQLKTPFIPATQTLFPAVKAPVIKDRNFLHIEGDDVEPIKAQKAAAGGKMMSLILVLPIHS